MGRVSANTPGIITDYFTLLPKHINENVNGSRVGFNINFADFRKGDFVTFCGVYVVEGFNSSVLRTKVALTSSGDQLIAERIISTSGQHSVNTGTNFVGTDSGAQTTDGVINAFGTSSSDGGILLRIYDVNSDPLVEQTTGKMVVAVSIARLGELA